MKFAFFTLLLALSFTGYAQRDVELSNQLRITGAVKSERTLSLSDLMKQKQFDLGDLSIKNHKGEEKSVAHKVKGILVKSLFDSVTFNISKPKELSELVLVFVASDNYKNIYSWNEIFNTEVGNQLYIITEKDGHGISEMDDRIQVVSLADINKGMRRMKSLERIEVKK